MRYLRKITEFAIRDYLGDEMAEQPRRVLITGANGVIGAVLRAHLSDRYDLRLMTRRPADFPSVVADITDLDAIQPAFEGIDAVIHLAGSAPVQTPWEGILQNNLIGVYNVYEAARRAGVAALIYASSNHAIGEYEIDAQPELYRLDDPRVFDHTVEVRPDSLYGVSKVYAEALGRYYHDRFGMRVYNLRIGSVRADDDPRNPEIANGVDWMEISPSDSYARHRATWLSQRDCAQLFERCLEATEVSWAVVYGISNNPRQFWDLSHARDLLGYAPEDSAPIGNEP
jgi:nucleoside-diphosphate-sugar epimerase